MINDGSGAKYASLHTTCASKPSSLAADLGRRAGLGRFSSMSGLGFYRWMAWPLWSTIFCCKQGVNSALEPSRRSAVLHLDSVWGPTLVALPDGAARFSGARYEMVTRYDTKENSWWMGVVTPETTPETLGFLSRETKPGGSEPFASKAAQP